MPKIIGSYYGGIILTKDKSFYQYCKKFQKENPLLNLRNLKIKYKDFFKKKNKSIKYDKTIYDSYDGNLTHNIFKCLKNFKLNIGIIKKRQSYIKKIFSKLSFDKKRLGPVILFHKKKFKYLGKALEIKHFNFKKNVESGLYEKCFILPVHFGIPDQVFFKKAEEIKKIYKLHNKSRQIYR